MAPNNSVVPRGDGNLADILYDLSVNFLLYVVLIIVFYMLVRFYLEEETESSNSSGKGYIRVSTNEDEPTKENESDGIHTESGPKHEEPSRGSFLNINKWGEPDGTRQEVIQRAIFCALGLIISFCVWGLVQERMLTQTYDGDFFEYSYGLVFLSRLGGLILSSFLSKRFLYFASMCFNYYSAVFFYNLDSIGSLGVFVPSGIVN